MGNIFNTEPHAQGWGADPAGERKHGYYIYISSHRRFPFKIQKMLVLVGNAITVSVECCQSHDYGRIENTSNTLYSILLGRILYS